MLDGWRGLAALAVVFHHLGVGLSVNLGYMAVMVFFVISGYCIAASADACRRRGYGFRKYMGRRLHRIYPPYFLALCFFAATRVIKQWLGLGMGLSKDFLLWVQQLTLTQWLSLLAHPKPFPTQNLSLFVDAFWSLNYEEQFYLVVGLLLFTTVLSRRSLLPGVAILMILALAWNIACPAKSYGFFLEYWLHFAVGILVYYRLCKLPSPWQRRTIDGFLLALVAGSLLVWSHRDQFRLMGERQVEVEWVVAGGFALLLISMRRWDAPLMGSIVGKGLAALGAITYSLYLIHQFNLHIALAIAKELTLHGIPQLFFIPIEVLVLVAEATVFWYLCERPFINKPVLNPIPVGAG